MCIVDALGELFHSKRLIQEGLYRAIEHVPPSAKTTCRERQCKAIMFQHPNSLSTAYSSSAAAPTCCQQACHLQEPGTRGHSRAHGWNLSGPLGYLGVPGMPSGEGHCRKEHRQRQKP